MTDQLRVLIREIIGLVTHPSVEPDSSSDSKNPEGEENGQENSEEMPSKWWRF